MLRVFLDDLSKWQRDASKIATRSATSTRGSAFSSIWQRDASKIATSLRTEASPSRASSIWQRDASKIAIALLRAPRGHASALNMAARRLEVRDAATHTDRISPIHGPCGEMHAKQLGSGAGIISNALSVEKASSHSPRVPVSSIQSRAHFFQKRSKIIFRRSA
jgi:hypothetical protein